MPNHYDVFLCYNSQDKPEVIEIARQLYQRGLKPWLDVWELRPGLSWQERLEEQIKQINSAAVFVGSSGLGRWQRQEIRAFLNKFANRNCLVIPILLKSAPQKRNLPIFLENLTWVDFRQSIPDPMNHLIWGITGVRPEWESSQPSYKPDIEVTSPPLILVVEEVTPPPKPELRSETKRGIDPELLEVGSQIIGQAEDNFVMALESPIESLSDRDLIWLQMRLGFI